MTMWYEDPKVLKEKRKLLGVTQTVLAKKAGVKLSLIADIESGRRRFSEDVRDAIWGALGDISIERRGVNPPEGQNALANLLTTTPQHTPSESPTNATESVFKDVQKFVAKFGLDKSPEEALREENAILKARISNYEAQVETFQKHIGIVEAQLESYRELCKLQDRRDAWFEPMSERIVSLESKVAELRDLVGLETNAVVSRAESNALKEKIQESDKGKDGL